MALAAKPTWRLWTLCWLILCVILVAGLWPFRPPPNDAAWIGYRNGVRFGGHGIAYAPGPSQPAGSAETGSSSLEIWFQPDNIEQVGTIVAFYSPADPTDFSVFQERSSLGFRLHNQRHLEGPHFYDRLGEVFRAGEPEFVTITSNSKVTTVYVDGAPAKTMPNFPLALRNLQGQLVAGAMPIAGLDPRQSQGWEGQLLGIATYARLLMPAEVARHYETWTKSGRPESLTSEGNLALYLFDERSGRLARNAFGAGADLTIPERDAMIHRPILALKRPNFWGPGDILVNIAGFVPLGFFFCACFPSSRPAWPAILVVVLTAFVISLGIELAQAYLPGRTSDLRDLVLNTLGGATGVFLYRQRGAQTLIEKAGLLSKSSG